MDGEHDNNVRRDGGARENHSRAPVALSSDAGPLLRAAFDVRPRTVKASRVVVPPRAQTGDAVLARSRRDLRGRHPGDMLFFGLTILFALLVIVVAMVMVGTLVAQSWPALTRFGLSFLTNQQWSVGTDHYGALVFIFGTLYTSFLALLLAAALILTVMIVPTITAISRDVLRAVPREQREGLLALGATRWETITRVVVPYARAGIVGAIILGLGRAVGETMAVTMVIGNGRSIGPSLFAITDTLASVIANQFTEATGTLYPAALLELGLIPLFVVLAYVVAQGASHLSLGLVTTTANGGGGLLNALSGTLLLIVLACGVGLPIGLLGGLYLAEFGRGRLATAVRFTSDVMAGLPSIVAGLVAYGLIVTLTRGFSALSGGVALGLLMFPTVLRTTEGVLRLVPDALREGGLALGLPRWRVIVRVVLPTAAGGIATAIILGIARVAGETAPLLFTAFGSGDVPTGLMQPVDALPLSIWNDSQAPDPQSHAIAWAGALLLVALVLFLNCRARLMARRFGGLRS